ncbi:Flagellar biosynthesis protein FlhB [gamma proteobacterium IMCC2047]|nr:Flagellar biosynthesis protein FlhB [gamma proteobacterium IMCC2047]
MAESDSGQEKTEEATPKRLEDAKKKGDIPRSKELNTTAILLGGTGALLAFGGGISAGLSNMMSANFRFSRDDIFDPQVMLIHLGQSMAESMMALIPFFIVVMLAAIIGPIALGGWVMSGKSLAPKGERISPLAGIKRMFAKQALMELLKTIAKFLLVATLSLVILDFMTNDILAIAKEDTIPAMAHTLRIVGWSVLAMSCTMILISIIDVPFQISSHAKKLKMTMQEVKDEMKNTEGKPEVKSRIRQLQYDMAQGRMMSAVPEADVVITNPEHYAVALKYNSDNMGAPLLVAKGADHIAFKIREIAKAHDIPVLEAPPLARAVFYSTELEQEIPAGLYVAVAQVLAYVFQLQRFEKRQGQRPGPMPDLPIPEELRRDE